LGLSFAQLAANQIGFFFFLLVEDGQTFVDGLTCLLAFFVPVMIEMSVVDICYLANFGAIHQIKLSMIYYRNSEPYRENKRE
jgi:hypothetical protein